MINDNNENDIRTIYYIYINEENISYIRYSYTKW